MARYSGQLLAPAEGFYLPLRIFWPFWPQKNLLCCFFPTEYLKTINPQKEYKKSPKI